MHICVNINGLYICLYMKTYAGDKSYPEVFSVHGIASGSKDSLKVESDPMTFQQPRSVYGVMQTLIHMVAPPCKCAIVRAYIFTFGTVQYILYRNKIVHILNPLNELYQSSLVPIQS